MTIRVATSQFSTSADFKANERLMLGQIQTAAKNRADLIHFPEACLSGYAGHDIDNYDGYDWDGLRAAATRIAEAAASNAIWIVFGSARKLSGRHKPHNSLYVINDEGQLVDRYDKRFCAGDETETTGDLAHYSPGDHFCAFEIRGARCGTLICHEYRYPELYREHARRGTQILLHSFHAGNIDPSTFSSIERDVGQANHALNPATTIAGITQIAATHSGAASNNLWISCSTSSAPRSCWGAFVVRPDGVCVGRLENERDGVLFTDIDPAARYYDSTRSWRERAIQGNLHSGHLVSDPRSRDRTSF